MSRDVRRAAGLRPSRRQLLRGAAAMTGVAAGSGLIRGFPTIWAQNIKDIKLVHVGGSYSAIPEIAKQASKDLGFEIEIQAVAEDAQLQRTLTQPKTIDVNDTATYLLYYYLGRNIVQPVPLNKYTKRVRVAPPGLVGGGLVAPFHPAVLRLENFFPVR